MENGKRELEFKRWFRRRFVGWSETYEPRHGSSLGMPDLQLLLKSGKRWDLLPVELKAGHVKLGRLYVSFLRPAQIGWHVRFMRAGGVARLVVGVETDLGKWTAWVPPWSEASLVSWKSGWSIADCRVWDKWKG